MAYSFEQLLQLTDSEVGNLTYDAQLQLYSDLLLGLRAKAKGVPGLKERIVEKFVDSNVAEGEPTREEDAANFMNKWRELIEFSININ